LGRVECGGLFEFGECHITLNANQTITKHIIASAICTTLIYLTFQTKVIGARTEKYADYFDILAAIVGYVPNVGVHVDENREPTMVIDATRIIEEHVLPIIVNKDGSNNDTTKKENGLLNYVEEVDSFFPVMGWICGNLSEGAVPLILGFDRLDEVTDDNLKAFCAAFGTTGTGRFALCVIEHCDEER